MLCGHEKYEHANWQEAIEENKVIFTKKKFPKVSVKKFDDYSLKSSFEPYMCRKYSAAEIEVWNEDTAQAGKRLLDEGLNPVVLNMANRFTFAGGDLTGNTQEENLAGRSNLSFEMSDSFYPMKYGEGIYSDKVTFIRDPKGTLIEDPYTLGVLSMGFINLNFEKMNDAKWNEVAEKQITNLLMAGVIYGHDSIVLGAWGCGAFGNDISKVAKLFKKVISKHFIHSYKRIVFAIVDVSYSGSVFKPFADEF